MPSVFTKIIRGEIRAHVVFRDAQCIAFLSIEPLQRGHVLLVPYVEIDHFWDVPPPILSHLVQVAAKIAQVQKRIFPSEKIAMMVAGFEVRHAHIHLVPVQDAGEMEFSRARFASKEELASVAAELIEALQSHSQTIQSEKT